MEDISKLDDQAKLDAFSALDDMAALDKEVIRSAVSIEDDYTRQSAIMILETKARNIKQARNFQKFLGIVKQDCLQKKAQPMDFVTAIDGIDLQLKTGDWICDDTGIRHFVNRNGNMVEEVASWQPIIINNIFYNQEMNTYRVQLAFKESEYAKVKTVTVNKSIIANSSSIVTLADFGISVTNQTAPVLVKYLNDLERLNVDTIPRNNAISRLGWVNNKEFVPYNSNICFDGETMYGELFNSVKCCGDYDKWKEMVKQETSTESKIILGSSFASPLVGLLNSLTFFTHLWGISGAGKSVALMYADSIWGNPQKLVQNLNGTAVALERMAGFFCNVPLCLDELQTLKKNTGAREGSFDDILYKLGQGRGKSRGRKDGSIDRVQTWAMSIITTGEEPITTDNSGGGAKNRVIDIYCKDKIFTNATRVAQTSLKNYGWAGKEFILKLIEFVEKNTVDTITDIYNEFFDYLMKTEPTEKQALAATMIAIGYTLMKHFIFDFDLPDALMEGYELLDAIRPMLINIKDIDNVDKFCNDLTNFVIQNKHHMVFTKNVGGHPTEYNPLENRLEVYGKITDKIIAVSSTVVQKFCNDRNTNFRKMVKFMADAGKIDYNVTDNGKEFTKPVKINGMCIRCICLKIQDTEQLSFREELTPIDDDNLPF